MMEKIRINKYLAQCGVCSRREADKLVEAGAVKINDVTALVGSTVDGTEKITVSGKVIQKDVKKYYAYYKPVGVVCTEKDEHAKKKIFDDLKLPVRVTYAGRLDKDSEGLMLLTNDGGMIDELMRGRNGHEKEYVVKVNKKVTEGFIERMQKPMYLKELDATTRECTLQKMGEYTFGIILTQGLNRQIRRMCENCGYRVTALKRIRINNVNLGTLKPGEYRELTLEEIKGLTNDQQKREN